MSVLSPETFLDLVQRATIECGYAGDPPATLLGASGELLQLMGWVNQSWMDLQQKHPDWGFKLQSPGVSFATVAGQRIYTPTQAGVTLGDVTMWKRETFRVYHTATGTPSEVRMSWYAYDDWRDSFDIGSLKTAQVFPVNFSITPELSLAIQCPLAGYTVTGDYYQIATPLEVDEDEPDLPAQYRMVIVYATMKFYGAFQSAPEVYDRGSEQYRVLVNKLEQRYCPEVCTAGALA